MEFLDLNNDVYYVIFSHINNVCTKYFLTNKHFYDLREQFLIKYHNNNESQYLPININPIPFILLKYCKFRELTKVKIKITKNIIQFLANKEKQQMKYGCNSKYHRKLIHEFCDNHNLKHDTVIIDNPNYISKDCCYKCKSTNIYIEIGDFYNPEQEIIVCENCFYRHEVEKIKSYRKIIVINTK